jgi:LmbE family N-acetylglucosaminyl deacetylase
MGDRPRRVLGFVAAHPDDDVMGAAGLIALHRDDPDLRFVLLHATDGGAGEIAPGSGATPATLGAVRREEDRRGWKAVGRGPDRHEWFGFPDGGLAALPDGVLEARIAAVFAEERPDVVMTFGPDGITGHPDHIAVSAATTAAFLRFARTGAAGDGGPGFRRLYHGAYPRSAFERMNAGRVRAGMAAFDPGAVYHPRGVPDATIACSVDLLPVVEVVTAAFREHRTQWSPPWSQLSRRAWRSAAGSIHLVQAWHPWTTGTPRLADPFEGLEPVDG